MPWVGGFIRGWRGEKTTTELLPVAYASKEDCCAAIAVMLFEKEHIFEERDEEERKDEELIPPDKWKEIAQRCRNVKTWEQKRAVYRGIEEVYDMPPREEIRGYLQQYARSEVVLRWLCETYGVIDFEDDDARTWSYILHEVTLD